MLTSIRCHLLFDALLLFIGIHVLGAAQDRGVGELGEVSAPLQDEGDVGVRLVVDEAAAGSLVASQAPREVVLLFEVADVGLGGVAEGWAEEGVQVLVVVAGVAEDLEVG